MKKPAATIAGSSLMLLTTSLMALSLPAFASFGGCVISPENPTIILGALGAGAASFPWLKARLQNRFSKRNP